MRKLRRVIFSLVGCLLTLAGCYPAAPHNRAEVTLTFANFRHSVKNGRHFFMHRRIFHEKNGISAAIKRARLCVENGHNCLEIPLNYSIPAGGKFIQTGHYFSTPLVTDRITYTYWLHDQHGYRQKLEKNLTIVAGNVIAIVDSSQQLGHYMQPTP